jgi:glycosyltransferase involved in cell wall biosynthesis
VDNGSADGTAAIARLHGAEVIVQPIRGYGNAYKVGIANARGEVIATGDADNTYPFGDLPTLLTTFERENADFMSTDRLHLMNRTTMKPSHFLGNYGLSLISKLFFKSPFRDSQSGMWLFRRSVWDALDVRSGGMAFSQEIKHEAYFRRFRCIEVPIDYGQRGGEVKLNAARDGMKNAMQIVRHRTRLGRRHVKPVAIVMPEADRLRTAHNHPHHLHIASVDATLTTSSTTVIGPTSRHR